MSVVTEILSLRQNHFSSMMTLISAIDRHRAAHSDEQILGRSYAVLEAADMLLTNVAAHAAEAFDEPPSIRKARRAVVPFQRKRRRSEPGQLQQRRLFA